MRIRSSFVSAFVEKECPGVEKRHLAQLVRVFRAEPVFNAFAELQHRAISALQAQRRQQRCAVRKQARRRGVLVFLRKRFVPLFENERMPNHDSRNQEKQQTRDEDDPEQRLPEKSGSLAALGRIVLRIVRFRFICSNS